jgi:dTDP-4-amino-4,6-dideoxygalactose transaminase
LLEDELKHRAERGTLPKAAVVVDVCGQTADWEPIQALCRKYGVVMIEDAAEALGATYRGRQAGSLGDIGCFSFNGNKIITTSGGGMLVTNNQRWVEAARHLATQARDPAAHYEHSLQGYNYRLSNLLAAVGRAQLRKLETRVAQRRRNFDFYRAAFGQLQGIDFMPEADFGRSTRWLTCLTLDPMETRVSPAEVIAELARHDIESRPMWKPMHLQPLFSGAAYRGRGVAEELFHRGLCLPSGSNMGEADLSRVATRLLTSVTAGRRSAAA